MTESSPEKTAIVQVAFCCGEESISERIRAYCRADFARTRVTKLESISQLIDESTPSPDLLIVDIIEDCDADSLFSATARDSLSFAEVIVLCSAEDAAKWQNMVLHEEVRDYFVIRPLNDPGYLKVQIQRAIHACAAKRLAGGSRTDASDTGDVLPDVSARRDSTPGVPRKRALILEDDDPSAEVLTDILIGAGFEVKRASSVIEAYRRFSDRRFDIFFVDLMMPGIHGAAVVRAVREKLQDAEAPIIVTSAFSDTELVEECLKEGASDYVIKPITRARLLPRIRLAQERS